jgi:flagellar biosynthesis/type III secretory pathway M-ring protein FliF/YscJ
MNTADIVTQNANVAGILGFIVLAYVVNGLLFGRRTAMEEERRQAEETRRKTEKEALIARSNPSFSECLAKNEQLEKQKALEADKQRKMEILDALYTFDELMAKEVKTPTSGLNDPRS